MTQSRTKFPQCHMMGKLHNLSVPPFAPLSSGVITFPPHRVVVKVKWDNTFTWGSAWPEQVNISYYQPLLDLTITDTHDTLCLPSSMCMIIVVDNGQRGGLLCIPGPFPFCPLEQHWVPIYPPRGTCTLRSPPVSETDRRDRATISSQGQGPQDWAFLIQ